MSVVEADSSDASCGIPPEEWSILVPLLPDRWPDGRPRDIWSPALNALQIAGVVSVLASAGLYLVASLAPGLGVGVGTTAALAFAFLMIFSYIRIGVLDLFRVADIDRLPGQKLPLQVAVLHERFATLLISGQTEEAGQQIRDAIRLAREELGATPGVLAELTYGLAMFHVIMDELGEAVHQLEEAEQLWKKVLRPDSLEMSEAHFSLATLYRALGDAQRELHHRRCIQVASECLGPDSLPALSNLSSLAEIREELGHLAEAEELYRRVIALIGERPGVSGKRALAAIDKLIALHLARRDYPTARSLLLQALYMTQRDYPDDHPFLADRLDDLGRLYLWSGAPERSEVLFERSQEIRRRAFGADTPLYTLSLCNLAELYAARGDHARALELFRRMSVVEDGFLGRAVLRRSERQVLAYVGMFYANACKYMSLTVSQYSGIPLAVKAAFELVQRRKAAGIEILANHRRTMLEVGDPRLASGLERLNEIRWQIARMSRTGSSPKESSRERRHRLATLQAERDEILRRD